MPPFRKPTLVTLRRPDVGQPWGFRLAGGVNQGQPFIVQKVIPDSIAHRNGLQESDLLVRIGNITLKGLTHEEVQEIILRCISTIDLFVIRNTNPDEGNNNSSSQTNPVPQSPIQQSSQQSTVYGTGISSSGGSGGSKSLTEQVLNRMVNSEQYVMSNSMDHQSSDSPLSPQHIYVKEREMYEYRDDFNSSPTPFRPGASGSGGQTLPPISPTNISYHQPNEQQWSHSSPDFSQSRDPRVFCGQRPQSPSGHSPTGAQNQPKGTDPRVFGLSRPKSHSPATSPQPPMNGISTSATPSPIQDQSQYKTNAPIVSPPPGAAASPVQDLKHLSLAEMQRQSNQRQPIDPNDKQFYAQNSKRPEHSVRHHGFDRPEIGRVVNDKRVFAQNTAPRLLRLGSNDGSEQDWKAPLPQMKTNRPEVTQLLPSQTRRQQTYIVQTPPTERNARPPPTGTLRRRIRPVWPPPDWSGRYIPKTGFGSGGRDSPTTRYDWPPSKSGSVDRDYDGTCSPRQRFSTPPPGALQQSWNPRAGSVTPPPGSRSYTPTRRVQNTAWPPPSNATPAGRVGMKVVTQSLPGSRRGSGDHQMDEYYVYGVSNRIPQTYRPPPQPQTSYTGYDTE